MKENRSIGKDVKYADEVELIDYLRVLWKYRFWIIGVTIFSALVALAISFLLPPIWEVSVVVEPGRFGSDVFGHDATNRPTGKIYPVDSAENVKAKILQGSYDTQVRTLSGWPFNKKLKWEVDVRTDAPGTVQTSASAVRVHLEVKDKELGLRALRVLINSLEKEFAERLEPFLRGEIEQNIIRRKEDIIKGKRDIENVLSERDANLAKYRDELRKLKNEIALLKQRESELSQEEGNVRKNTGLLLSKRDSLIEGEQSKTDPLALVLYTTSLQQNIAYSNQLATQLNDVKRMIEERESNSKKVEIEMVRVKEDASIRIKKLEADIQKILATIGEYEERRKFAKSIEVIQQPTVSYRPVKPKKLLNMSIVGILTLVISVFGAFLIEYISGKKEDAISNFPRDAS